MTLDPQQRRTLLELGRESIGRGVQERRLPAWDGRALDAALGAERASFVTLTAGGALRGCCGTLVATRPMAEDVWRNAWTSAFSDPRFPPLATAELRHIHLQVSILSPLEPVTARSERDLLLKLRPAIDGLVLELDSARATFLPAVWEQLSDPEQFLGHLKRKAGWPADFWSDRLRIYRYTTECFGEGGSTP